MVKSFLFLGLSLLGSMSIALEVHRQDDKIFLSDSSCQQVKSDVRSLAAWSKNEGSTKSCPVDNIKTTSQNGTCSYEISNCVPDHVLKYEDVQPKDKGPNCWNLALVMKNILPALRFSSPDEMSFYMKPPLCRGLDKNEKRQPGDVVAIRMHDDDMIAEDHAFIYISDSMAYSKNSEEKEIPYKLQSLEDVYKRYKVPQSAACRSNQMNPKANCDVALSFYRCTSMQDYLRKNPKIPQQLTTAMDEISSFEGCLQTSVIKGTELLPEAKKSLMEVTKALTVYVQTASSSDQMMGMKKDERDFILGSLQLRLEAIEGQLGKSMRTIDFDSDFLPLQKAFDDAAEKLDISQ